MKNAQVYIRFIILKTLQTLQTETDIPRSGEPLKKNKRQAIEQS